jgi:glycosyltransferase involved in cell wall biosynthesis
MALLKLSGLNIPYFLNVHSGKFWMIHTFPFKPLMSFSLKSPNAITCVSRALVDAVEKIRTENVYHLPLGVDLALFNKSNINEEIRNKYNLVNKKVIVFIGTMISAKGVNQLTRAMPNIISDFPETILLMIGEGHLMNHLKKYTEDHGISSNVIFTGKIAHYKIPDFLSVADLLCLPSYMEGFPMVVKEALAAEVLVLATELPVFKFEPELKNIIFFVENVNEIALEKKIKEILFCSDTFDDRKRKGRNFVEKNASWQSLITQFKSISEQE